jgi:hypothetical protein
MTTYLLNQHPHIFVALEADAMWNVYTQGSLTVAPDDRVHEDFQTRRITNADSYLTYDELVGTPSQKLYQDLLHIKDNGVLNRQDAYPEKTDVRWIGEKKLIRSTALLQWQGWAGQAGMLRL